VKSGWQAVTKKPLTYEQIVQVCQKINERYLPDEEAFLQTVHERLSGNTPSMLNMFQTLLAAVDDEIQKIEQQVEIKPTCAKGCAYCCYFPIIVTEAEAKLMMEYVHQLPFKEREKIVQHLKRYFNEFESKIEEVSLLDWEEETFKEEYMASQLPCPFLDRQTNTCYVYGVRPIPCRTYLNYGHPQVCAQSYIPKEPFSYEFFYEYYMNALHDFVQEQISNGKDVGLNYPDDLFIFDYLPIWLKNFFENDV
jgi:Fe-S-cluster containining protein